MANAGDKFEVELKPAHLGWGVLGKSRENNPRSFQEAYIQIPTAEARRLNILKGTDFHAISNDGLFNAIVRATGSINKFSPNAKQFQSKGNLKLMGIWLKGNLNAQPGDRILVEFISTTEIKFTFIRNAS